MKRLLLFLIALGVAASLAACGATLKHNVKAEKSGVGDSGWPQYGAASAQHPDWWVYDTPYGY
ncbi:MAG: hypothetical protein C4532_07760 [Candidatus Abyssobacteria bacterium SURF_17]|uniref:Lipoprotein n=1 Tax=Candidatus Abyssobacteria bacterium SURF_17 TaxID=2093361 RepID=A0A419F0G0_9BACT|nr:MAG: hypothetical protein C4532_07760 [Candidatus Abyssubacteria bacterium SURF_17]